MPYRWRYDDPIGSPLPPLLELSLHVRKLGPDITTRLAEAWGLSRALARRSEELLAVTVAEARWMRWSWSRIGARLALTKQATHQRFGPFADVYIATRKRLTPSIFAMHSQNRLSPDMLWVLVNSAIFDVMAGKDHILQGWTQAADVRRWAVQVQRRRRLTRSAGPLAGVAWISESAGRSRQAPVTAPVEESRDSTGQRGG